jgi:integrase
MATYTKLSSGNWRVQIRRKGQYASDSFRRRSDAESWALETERRIDRGEEPRPANRKDPTTFGDLIDLHISDLLEVNKAPLRSKSFSLDLLKRKLGKIRISDLSRERLITFGRERAKEGAGPVTISMDLGYLRTVITHAAAIHGISVSLESVDLARIALKRLGLIGKSHERDRRPTANEIEQLLRYFSYNKRQSIPMVLIVKFAIGTAMREEEICRIKWEDIDEPHRTVIVRDRKDPRLKQGNHQKVPLLDATGFDAWEILQTQKAATKKQEDSTEKKNESGRRGRIFPYNSRSVGAAFRRACRKLKIEDLHFHDLRHDATSRLFEAGYTIEQVALVTGHKDWKMLRRYTHLRPEQLHTLKLKRNLGSPANSAISSGEPTRDSDQEIDVRLRRAFR